MNSHWLFSVALVAILAAPSASAQSACIPGSITVEGPPFYETWVDPTNGSDGSGVVSAPGGTPSVTTAKASPFQTINGAIGALTSASLSATNPGIVHLMPAVYDTSTQTFPISMKNYVHIQGISARECVLRGGDSMNVFYPIGEDCECGTYDTQNVIVDYSTSTTGGDYSEMIDGVTFQGGDVQVYTYGEDDVYGRISNSIFDMVHYPGSIPGPDFGILLVHVYDPSGYRDVRMDVFNNTFVMAWVPSDTGSFKSRASAIGICDVNDPLCGNEFDDPDHSLRNIGASNIQNNLFRELSGWTSNAFLGMAFDDTAESNGNPTNMFRNETDDNGTYCVNQRSTSSGSPSDVGYDDPAFVGEMLTDRFGYTGTNVGRDWRVLPDSPVINMGIAPTSGTVTAFNGLTYTEPSVAQSSCTYSAIDSFDFDGEGYGNRRYLADGLNNIDIGYDQFEVAICSGYGNESVFIPNSSPCGSACYCAPHVGLGVHGFIFPGGATAKLRMSSAGCPATSYTIRPGVLNPPTTVGSNLLWFSTPPLLFTGSPAVYSWTPPDTTTSHSWGLVTRPSTTTANFRLFQGQYGGAWSGLQASFD